MSQSVERLKELLFDTEARTLSDVQQRLARSETDLQSHARDRQMFAARLDAVFARAGTEERFRLAVAEVLDRALRHAETERHAELSAAVAPLIVRTIRTEITNSRDELVDALYPITGRMVKAYVASAIADLAAQINRKVEANPVMLRLRSLATGKSVAELALADNNKLRVEEIYLIRRGTGELIGQWPQADRDNRSQAMSGVLAAINEFATDAFGNDGASLREIDMGDARVYLRASPLYLLAARCTGAATPNAERLLDDSLLSTIERCQSLTAADRSDARSSAVGLYQNQLRQLSDELSAGIDSLPARPRSAVSPALALFGGVCLILASVFGWFAIDHLLTQRTRDTAHAALAATPGTAGYIVDIDVGSFGRRVSLTGLVRDDAVKSALLERLTHDLPSTRVTDHLTPLPGAHGEIGPAIDRAAISASLHRAALRLDQAAVDLPLIAAESDQPQRRDIITRIAGQAARAAKDLRDQSHDLQGSPKAQHKLAEDARQMSAEITALAAGQKAPAPARPTQAALPPASPAEAARNLELAADQLAIVTAAILQADAVRKAIPAPATPIVRAPDITAFERLSVYVRTHAVFFADDLAYRTDEHAAKTIDELARLMRDTEALVRVVGYTDAKGAADHNTALSENRARKVAEALTARGVPANRLVVVGRHDANQIASGIGETSPNRRVEFELGFDGEGAE